MPNRLMRQDARQVRIENDSLDAGFGINALGFQNKLFVFFFDVAKKIFCVWKLVQEVTIPTHHLVELHGLTVFILGGHENVNVGPRYIRVRDHAVAGVEQLLHIEHSGDNLPAEQLGETFGDVAVEFIDDAQKITLLHRHILLEPILTGKRRVGREVRLASLDVAIQKGGIVSGGLDHPCDRLQIVPVASARGKAVGSSLDYPRRKTPAGAAVVSSQAAVEHHHGAIAILLSAKFGVSRKTIFVDIRLKKILKHLPPPVKPSKNDTTAKQQRTKICQIPGMQSHPPSFMLASSACECYT